MKIAGIIAEYNPFHNGHADHIAFTRDRAGAGATHVVAVMSGNFVQRGEPAAFPRADRVKAALAGGADLILELPVPWALSSAEGFAFGGVSLLHALGCVDTLSFGSECGDIDRLKKAAALLESPRALTLIRYHMEQGRPAAEAHQKALAELGGSGTAALLDNPNNILGIEYIKALHRLDSPIEPFTVRRVGAGHDEEYPLGGTASASFLRRLAREGRWQNAAPFMPREGFATLSETLKDGCAPALDDRMERAILLKLRRMSAEHLRGIAGVSEGLENRLLAAANEAVSLEDLLQKAKTRRYPLSRLKRLIWCAMLGIPAEWATKAPPYLRVLGMTERGQEILAAARDTAALPLISRGAQGDKLEGFAHEIWDTTLLAAEWYDLTLPTPKPHGGEYTDGVIKL